MSDEPHFININVDNFDIVFDLVKSVYRGLEDVTLDSIKAIVSSAEYSMAAMLDGKPVAFASAFILPGIVEVRDLAVDPAHSDTLKRLVENLLSRLEPKLRDRLVRVPALGVPSIIRAVSLLGLEPRRRILKVKWLLGPPIMKCAEKPGSGFLIIRVSELGQLESVAKAYLDGLSTHWRWWIEADEGGYGSALSKVTGWLEDNPSRWFAAVIGDRVIGAAGYAPHPRLDGVAWLAGVAVRPEYRLLKIGWALLCSVLSSAGSEGFEEAVVYTYSPVIGLAPGATLYLKSGGLIQAEYVHFEGRLAGAEGVA